MNTTPILRATNIVKKLGGKTILNDVSLFCRIQRTGYQFIVSLRLQLHTCT